MMEMFNLCAGMRISFRAFVLSLGLSISSAQMTVAQDITLKTKDGSTTFAGRMTGFADGAYLLDVPGMGVVNIKASEVDCIGSACDIFKTAGGSNSKSFGIYGSRTVGTTLVPNLLRGYAKSTDAKYEIIATDDAAERIVRLTNRDGSLRFEVDLQTRGSGSAFPALAEGKAVIGVADRRMKDSDLKKIAPAGIPELRDTENEIVLGVDGIVLITHPDNPVRNLTAQEVAKIFSGEITNWLELGGGNFPINVNSFNESSGDRAVLLDGLVRPTGRDEMSNVTRHRAYQDLVDAVMVDRGGIGYVGRWLARTNDVNLMAIRENCGLLSSPTDFRMKIEGYSLSRRLYAYKRPGPLPDAAQAFLDWVGTKEAQAYVKESHFIDRELERMRLEDMGMMLVHTAAVEPDFNGEQYSEMMRQLRGADRLSTSFRFRSGSSILDVESVRNVSEIADRINAGEFDGFEVLLVGFADSVGERVQNTRLAYSRALAVQEILGGRLSPQAAQRVPLVPQSFGELLPLSCNGDPIGRARNRRVEIWLRLPGTRSALR